MTQYADTVKGTRISVKCESCDYRAFRVWRYCGCEDFCDHSGYGQCPKCHGRLDSPVNINKDKYEPDSRAIILNIVRPSNLYIGVFLGDLELAVMEKFWDIYPDRLSCKSVHRKLRNDDRDWAMTTIGCTVKRLAKKGILTRHGPPGKLGGYAHMFSASCTENEFIRASVGIMLKSLHDSFPNELKELARYYI